MKFQFVSILPEEAFAANLRRDTESHHLVWDISKGAFSCLIQSTFGEPVEGRLREITEAMNSCPPEEGRFTEVMRGYSVRILSAAEKARLGGCHVEASASRYTVCLCRMEEAGCLLYPPYQSAMLLSYVDLPYEVRIRIEELKKSAGIGFFKKETATGFFKMTFPPDFGSAYISGDLHVVVKGFSIPVSRGMVEQGEVFFKTEESPVLVSSNKGLRLI